MHGNHQFPNPIKSIADFPQDQAKMPSCVFINDQLYQVYEDGDSLSVKSCYIGKKFVKIKCDGKAPSKREGYCCVALTAKQFALIGGSTKGVNQPEIYLFNIETNEWSKPQIISTELGVRVMHRAVTIQTDPSNYDIYLFGGNSLTFCNPELLLFKLSENYGSCFVVPCKGTFPCGRYNHSMVYNDGKIFVFGGINAFGEVLGDLWELDLNISPFSPKWELIINDESMTRHSNILYTKEDGIYVAGGISESGEILHDIWRFSFSSAWEQISVFQTNNLVFTSQNNELLDISKDSVKYLEQFSPLSILNNQFEKLAKQQTEIHQSIMAQEKKIHDLQLEIASLQELKKRINSKGIYKNEIISKTTEEKLRNEVIGLRKKLITLLDQVVESSVRNRVINKPPKSLLFNFSMELMMKLATKTEKFERQKRELQAEKEIYSSQKEALQKLASSSSNNSTEVDKNAEMNNSFVRKLKELETIHNKTRAMNEKLNRAHAKCFEDDGFFIELMSKMSQSEENLEKTQTREEKLKVQISQASHNLDKIKECLAIWKDDDSDDKYFKKKVKDLESEQSSLQEKISNEVKTFVRDKKNILASFNQNLSLMKTTLETSQNTDYNKKLSQVCMSMCDAINDL
ncbi:Kel2p [Histomonas meleagridis]|uniref:Kel2p n=1 Tax=Histomonas meleagridis TaxID=135588 RepID=UPI00355A7623|nr:Kel2p [Histomonas meleagridis]KAH0802037.1 Kel2p [Histomonas meleagridis]